ncbi:hypothetical protein AZL_021050 [Azospirillum sp. B510]|uniref:hypothetical protein n=1 Tax=Azospirillum sp. (strain B510) TaxID=137722 RepID=UPI0001C4BDCB|nr:hypothetical protein [Azospirillum sp. B510]BAI72743.1 hypothetical protein AZL_021050 [Azospirillum sp. B510]
MSSTVNTDMPPVAAPDVRLVAPGRQVVFSLVADADPGTLPRILEYVAKRGLVPLALRSHLIGETLDITLEVGDLPQAETDHIGRCLGQIPMVARVTVSELAATAPLADSLPELVAAE